MALLANLDKQSHPEQFAQSLGLCPADGNFGLLLVVHAQLIRALEPRHDLFNAVDVHQIRAVRAPEKTLVQAIQQFFQGAAVGLAFHAIYAA